MASAIPCLRRKAGLVVESVFDDPTVHLIPQSHNTFRAGLALYRARPDKGYSLTDCIPMKTMEREGLTDVLTNDRDLEQAGFRALFAPDARQQQPHRRAFEGSWSSLALIL